MNAKDGVTRVEDMRLTADYAERKALTNASGSGDRNGNESGTPVQTATGWFGWDLDSDLGERARSP